MKVEIAFDTAANGLGNFLTLDDPVKGQLDTSPYVLSGDVLNDVTQYVRNVSIKRGRSKTLEKFTAGVANIDLDNRNRYFDPLYTGSPYYGNIGPKKQVIISEGTAVLFTSNIEDWDYSYSISGDSVATVKTIDGFAVIAPTILAQGTAVSQLTGARVGAVLDSIDWPTTARTISTGQAMLNADIVGENVNALAYLQQVELSEPGALFIGKTGNVTFKDRNDLQTYTSGVTFGTGGIPFVEISPIFGTEEMLNLASVTYYGGSAVAGTVTAANVTSQGQYGVIDQTFDTLLNTSADAQAFADWQVAIYGEPLYRVDRLTVRLSALGTAQLAQVLNLELGDAVQVSWTPNNVGSAINQVVTIDGIDYTGTPSVQDITFTMSQTLAAFILDDLTYGTLDENNLGF